MVEAKNFSAMLDPHWQPPYIWRFTSPAVCGINVWGCVVYGYGSTRIYHYSNEKNAAKPDWTSQNGPHTFTSPQIGTMVPVPGPMRPTSRSLGKGNATIEQASKPWSWSPELWSSCVLSKSHANHQIFFTKVGTILGEYLTVNGSSHPELRHKEQRHHHHTGVFGTAQLYRLIISIWDGAEIASLEWALTAICWCITAVSTRYGRDNKRNR